MAKRRTRPAGALSEEGARYIPTGIDQPEKLMQTAASVAEAYVLADPKHPIRRLKAPAPKRTFKWP
jgi:hypothetical protein